MSQIQELITLLVEVEKASAAASSNDPRAQIRSDVTAGGTALRMLDSVATTNTGDLKPAANGQGPSGESGTSSTIRGGRQDMQRQISESPASAKELPAAPGSDFGGSIIARAAMDAANLSSSPSSSAAASAAASASAAAFPSLPAAHGNAAPHRAIAAFPSLAALLGGEHEHER